MATPGVFNMSIYRGDSYRWQFKLWADTGKTTPVDLTDVVAASEIRDKPSGKKVTSVDCTVTLPNIVDLYLDAAKSKALAITRGAWDLQLTYPNDEVATVVAGSVTIVLDVTESGVAAHAG